MKSIATVSNCTRRSFAALSPVVLNSLPVLVCIGLAVVAVAAQQGGGTPSQKPVDQVMTSGRNWLITIAVPLVGGAALGWAAVNSSWGDRQGMSKIAMGFVSILIGLMAVSIVNLAISWVS